MATQPKYHHLLSGLDVVMTKSIVNNDKIINENLDGSYLNHGSSSWNRKPNLLLNDETKHSIPSQHGNGKNNLPLTVAIMGTHCAGKRTIGKRVAELLGFTFHPELGDVLRPKEEIVLDKHKVGYGCVSPLSLEQGEEEESWDDMLFRMECERDKSSYGTSRIVETWHFGNLMWALGRNDDENNVGISFVERNHELVSRTRKAIQCEVEKRNSCVLLVYLMIEPETSVKRREDENENALRLPLHNDTIECKRLHQQLQVGGLELLQKEMSYFDDSIPLLQINNDKHGEDAINETANKIVEFIKSFCRDKNQKTA